MYVRSFGVGEFKYATRIFQGANVVAMATKCRQKIKNGLILVLCKVWRQFLRAWWGCQGPRIQICHVNISTKGVAMSIKFRKNKPKSR